MHARLVSNFLNFLIYLTKLMNIVSFYFFHTHEDIHNIFAKTRHAISEIIDLLSRFLPQEVQDNKSAAQFSVELENMETKKVFAGTKGI